MVAEQKLSDSGLVSRAEMEQILQRRLRSSDFSLLEYSAVTGQASSQGFLGTHLVVRAHVLFQEEERHLNFFAKAIPSEPSVREMVDAVMGFEKENAFYNVLYASLTEAWENGLKTPDPNPFEEPEPHWGPVCYLCTNELVVMQDLTKIAYRAIPSWADTGVDFDTAKLMLRAIAGLHASSVVVKSEKKCDFLKITPQLEDESFLSTDPTSIGRIILITGIRAIVDGIIPQMLEQLSIPEAQRAEEYQRLSDIMYHDFSRLTLKEIRSLATAANCNLQVVSHGDCWPSNMMMRYSEDGAPQHCVLVDFQLTRWSPPAWDVLMCLLLSCHRKFREEHMEALLKSYYADLAGFTNERGVHLEPLMSQGAFLESARRILPLAQLISCIYLNVNTAPKDEIGEVLKTAAGYTHFMTVNRTEESRRWFKNDVKYNKLVGSIICEKLDLQIPKWSTSTTKSD